MRQINQIIVVDQDPNQKSRMTSKKISDLITAVSINQVNLSLARNTGIEYSNSDITIFFDDDVEISKQTLISHMDAYKNEYTAGVAGRVINEGEDVPKNTDVRAGKIQSLATNFTKNFWSTQKQTVDFPYGCNMSFRTEVLKREKGFDVYFPPPLCAFEEIDMGIRARKYGDMTFVPDALVTHKKYPTGGTRLEQRHRNKLYYQSYGYLLHKHVSFPASLISLAIRMRTALIAGPFLPYYFLKGYLVL